MQKNNFIIFRGHPLFLIRQLIFKRFLTELFAAKLSEYELNYKFTFKLNEHFADHIIYILFVMREDGTGRSKKDWNGQKNFSLPISRHVR